ncbi:MAG: hypothetical protein KKD18_04930 [Nanoarchaeota archaeon]|nr:hypothetical protein [Nanoarchaeota archaeon]MBU0977735.1 hypothetical protein [Nanoarchaeota archaeon]
MTFEIELEPREGDEGKREGGKDTKRGLGYFANEDVPDVYLGEITRKTNDGRYVAKLDVPYRFISSVEGEKVKRAIGLIVLKGERIGRFYAEDGRRVRATRKVMKKYVQALVNQEVKKRDMEAVLEEPELDEDDEPIVKPIEEMNPDEVGEALRKELGED